MKRKLALLAALAVGGMAICGVSAKSVNGTILGDGSAIVALTRFNTSGPLHTAVVPSYLSTGAIRVRTEIQRPNNKNAYTYVDQRYDTVTQLWYHYEGPFPNISGTKDTKAIWYNQTSGSRLEGNFYINPGLEP